MVIAAILSLIVPLVSTDLRNFSSLVERPDWPVPCLPPAGRASKAATAHSKRSAACLLIASACERLRGTGAVFWKRLERFERRAKDELEANWNKINGIGRDVGYTKKNPRGGRIRG